ncbi:MAG: TIGR03905 family TSCPD domain-containing protein [Termitinemataceae bacterium]|nr:MAG: TIGR03905 family TSCPD domain-containing protein [Termitinemataceae bacterium]
MFEYKTNGTCSSKIFFDMDGTKVKNVKFEGGCNGNLKAIASLVEGMEAKDLAVKLKGIQCGTNTTSCGDQLVRAVEKAMEHT